MTKNLIIIFTRNPELGKVKTRLAKTIGNASALAIYKKLLEHTEITVRNLNADKAIYYSVKIRHNDLWNNKYYQKHRQIGEDLGARMLNAFEDSFQKDYEKVVIIGSDLLDLTADIIENAFEKLNANDVVIGPAKDGGYYLLGIKQLYPSIFKNKNWGTSSVRKDTLSDLKNSSVHLLKELNDIDTFEDMKHYNELKPFYNTHD